MGLFSRKPQANTSRQRHDVVVLCAFRELTNPEPLRNFDPEYSYAYRWALPSGPAVGQWALVDSDDGPKTVIVGKVGANSYVRQNGVGGLKTIRRLVPDKDVSRARESIAQSSASTRAAEMAWLEHCRFVAGIVSEQPKHPIPKDFGMPLLPEPNPLPETADERGSTWWRASKKAEELGAATSEVERFKELARAWYRLRDAKIKANQIASVTSIASRTDLAQAIHDVESGKQTGDRPGDFLGKPMWDWLPYIEQLAKGDSAEADTALSLVYALISVAERESIVSRREPAAGYTERAAIMHRKRKEYAAEVAVIERWERACPPERRGPGAVQAKLAQRLVRAKDLADKQLGT
jgi:hypothetical protein